MTEVNEYVIDGDNINKLLDGIGLNANMLPGQAFDVVEKKLVKGLMEEIDKVKPQTVRFLNLEAISSGPHGALLYAICGGLAELIDSLTQKGITVTGAIQDRRVLPQNLVVRVEGKPKTPPASAPKPTS